MLYSVNYMFLSEIGSYTAPVLSYSELVTCLPSEALSSTPEGHQVTIKTCNNPQLLARSIGSLLDNVSLNITPLVVDDSRQEDLRDQNQQIAADHGARYCAVRGRHSLVSAFSEYIAETEYPDTAQELTRYLERIVTDYPQTPSEETWGGVAGAQNLGHLFNVMHFGRTLTPKTEWLSTFIDDDILMPDNANNIFKMIQTYHGLGSVGLIAGGYLRHSGNPIALARRTMLYLAKNRDSMTPEEIGIELNNLMQRTPTVGLRDERASDNKYSNRPEFTMTFPGGNYSLSGPRGFEVPVPVVGVEDLGYAAMLQLFLGARNLGVARVPDFIHARQSRRNGGDAHGTLRQFCEGEKDVAYLQFQRIAAGYAEKMGMPPENIDGLTKVQEVRRRSQLKQQREVVQATAQLMQDERLTDYSDLLGEFKTAVHDFALTKYNTQRNTAEGPLDEEFVFNLVDSMFRLHPHLVRKAYDFGAYRLGGYNWERMVA